MFGQNARAIVGLFAHLSPIDKSKGPRLMIFVRPLSQVIRLSVPYDDDSD